VHLHFTSLPTPADNLCNNLRQLNQQTFWCCFQGSVNRSLCLFHFDKKKHDMHWEKDSRGKFVGRGKSLMPTTSLTPPQPRIATSPTQTRIPSIAGKHKLLEVLRSEIQHRDSPTSSTKAIIEE